MTLIPQSKATSRVIRKLSFYLSLVATSAVLAELLAMQIIKHFSLPYPAATDILILLTVLGPVFYLLLFRPMVRFSRQRDEVEVLLEKRRAEERSLVEAIEEGILRMDTKGLCTFANPAAVAMLGYQCEQDLLGKSVHETIHHTYSDGTPFPVSDCAAHKMLQGEEPLRLEAETLWRADGSKFPAEYRSYPVLNDEGKIAGAMIVFNDISERQEREAKIRQLAFFDVLTGLPNRETLQDRMQQALVAAERQSCKVAVMFLDLDRFKLINDSLGHDFGDKLLIAVSKGLKAIVRKSDTVARLGGDEFVVLLPFLESVEGAQVVAQKILDLFNEPFLIGGKQIHTATSIGISMYPENGTEGAALLKSADAAMYHAKSNGRRSYRFFSREISAQIEARVAMEIDLRRALEYNEFDLYYQPQFDTKKGKICGVEALLRWRHPERGFVSPADFIPVAEEAGLITELGSQVLAIACTQLRFWQAGAFPELTMAINISSSFFTHPDFIGMLENSLRASNISPGTLDLEVNERTVMEIASYDLLTKLEELSVQLSIDDFGTGYSSLTYLKHFPISKIKIDRSFVREIHKDANDATIVQTIIAMSHALGLRTIAEGVETMEQVNFLCKHKCDEMQGYLFAHPMPADKAEYFIKTWKKPDISPCTQTTEGCAESAV